jgi:hypothetical protein
MSVSRLPPLSCGDASTRDACALAGTTGRRADSGNRDVAGSSLLGLALEDEIGDADCSLKWLGCGPIGFSLRRVVPLKGAGLGALGLGAAFFGGDSSVSSVLPAPPSIAIDATSATGRGLGEWSAGLSGECCWSEAMSALAQPAAKKSRTSRQVCQLPGSSSRSMGIMREAPNGARRKTCDPGSIVPAQRDRKQMLVRAAGSATRLIPTRLVMPSSSDKRSFFRARIQNVGRM